MNKKDKPVVRDDKGRWLRVSGSLRPRRPVSSRQKISEKRYWQISRRVTDLIKQNAAGAELGPVLETIEAALRSDQAKLIEG